MNHAFPGLGIPAGFKRLPWGSVSNRTVGTPRLSGQQSPGQPLTQSLRGLFD